VNIEYPPRGEMLRKLAKSPDETAQIVPSAIEESIAEVALTPTLPQRAIVEKKPTPSGAFANDVPGGIDSQLVTTFYYTERETRGSNTFLLHV
jgi:hypothetical protein